MKNKKLIVLVLALLLALGGAAAAVYGKKNAALDLQFSDGYKLVAKPNSEASAENMNAVKAILEKRLEAFGCAGTVTIVDGQLEAVFTAKQQDMDTLKKYLLMPGVLTLRNTEDEILLTAEDMAEEPMTVGAQTTTQNYISLAGGNSTKWSSVTTALSLKKESLVIWVDFDPAVDKYSASKPNYLAAASVTQVFSDGATFPTTVDIEQLRALAAVVNSGEYPVRIEEVSMTTVKARSAAFGSAYYISLAAAALAGLSMFVLFGKISVISALLSAVYAALCFALAAFAEMKFNTFMLVCIGAGLLAGLSYQSYVLDKSRREMLKGRNASYSVSKAFRENFKAIFEDNVLAIAAGFAGFIMFAMKYSEVSIGVIIAFGCALIVLVLAFRYLLQAGAEELFDYSWFRINKEELPDVNKGESATIKVSEFDFVKYLKLPFEVVLTVCAVLALIAVYNKIGNPQMLVVFAVIIVAAVIYVAVSYKRFYPLTVLFTVLCSALVTVAIAALTGNVGYALVGFATVMAFHTLVIAQLKSDYRALAKEKVNNEKIEAMVNRSLNENFANVLKVMAITALAWFILSAVFSADLSNSLLAMVLCIVAGCYTMMVSAKFWMRGIASTFNARKNAGRRSDGSETTITGINNVR